MKTLVRLCAAATALLLPAIALATPAVDAAPPSGGHDSHGGIEWITPVFGHSGKVGLLWMLVNFAVLMWLLEKLLFKKLRARTAEKSDAIKTELERARTARAEAETVMSDVRTRLDKLDAEVQSILDEAKQRGEADRQRIVEAAEREAERIKAAARTSAENEAEARRRQLEAEIVDQAVARAESILRQRFDANDERRMVDDFVGQLPGTFAKLSSDASSSAGAAT